MEIIKSYLTENPCYKANVNKSDSRYTEFQTYGARGLMLHSVGCAQPDASVFIKNWNKPTYTRACVHAFIDANSGIIFQALPWNFRGWHAGGSANNTHIGVEMCESKYIKYTGGANFEILDKTKALEDCKRTYSAAVELFAKLCIDLKLDPLTAICSHCEGGKSGIASAHADPEHYWNGLGAGYTMNGFRQAVKAQIEKQTESDALYRIQVGAFRNKAYAEAFLADVQQHYPNAFITATKK